MIYGFQLGREFKLSISELLAVFPEGNTVFVNEDVLIMETEEDIIKKADKLGGTIKIFEVTILDSIDAVFEEVLELAYEKDGKFNYGISVFGRGFNLKRFLMDCKKTLKGADVSSRFVNKDFKNLSSAQIAGEWLIKKGADISVLEDPDSGKTYFGKTIWVQDIYAYSKRDYSKQRDMQVGMLPPKLSQMMINLSGGQTIYDPFVGLGTILIESIHMGNNQVFGSDLSDSMVEASVENLKDKNAYSEIIKLNAKFIEESSILRNHKIDAIVTEGYLGEIMTKTNISVERIEKQRKSLQKIYEPFFAGLKKIDYKGTIVISFPFWEMRGRYFYADNLYDIIEYYTDKKELLPESLSSLNSKATVTKSGSLLYKRPDQLVGREIFKLKIK